MLPNPTFIFCAISSDLVHAFQSQFLRWDLKLKPVVLCTMNPVKRGKFSLIIKGPFTLHVASIRTRVQISTGTRSFVKNRKIWYFTNKMLQSSFLWLDIIMPFCWYVAQKVGSIWKVLVVCRKNCTLCSVDQSLH